MPSAARHPSIATAVAALCAAATHAAVPYANDFSTRVSGPMPSDRWMETAYFEGPLARNVADVTSVSPYAGATAYQDAWAAKAGWSSGAVAFTVADDGGNAAALANGTRSSYAAASVVMQPLGNEFTTGTLRLSVDIRTPPQGDSLNPGGNAMTMFAPVYKAGLDVAATDLPIPMRLGPGSLKDGDAWNLRALSRGPAPTTYGQYDTRNALEAGLWVRYEATLDLDSGTYTATFSPFGAEHPAFDSIPGTAFDFRTYEPAGGYTAPTTLSFQDALTHETGGVAGIALWTQGLRQADAAVAPMFDNVRVWHDGELVYENDFATRRYRQLAPAATTAGAYAPVPTTNAVLSAHYDHGSWENDYGVEEAPAGLLVPEAGTNGADCEGWDGWRRRAGGAGFSLLDPNKNGGYGWANGTVLRITKKNTLGVLAVPLGQAVTNGKVRLRFDLMPGRKSVMGNYTEAFAMCFLSGGGMGEAAYTGSTSRDTIWKGKAVCGAGYYMNGSANSEYNPGNVVYGAGTLKANYSPTTSAQMCNWHRYVVTADLDARTYGFAVYKYGTTGQPADYDVSSLAPIAEKGSLSFMTDAPAAIDSLFLASQGHGSVGSANASSFGDTGLVYGKFPLFDNLRVCLVAADGSDGLELYRCDFEESVRRALRPAATLAAAMDREGADHWTRRGAPYGTIAVESGDARNPAAVLAGMNGGAGHAVQPLGTTSRNCAAADLVADIRPPRHWSRADGAALVEAGGDDYAQGVNSPSGAWRTTAPRVSFGFACGAAEKTFGRYESIAFAAGTQAGLSLSDAAVDPAHWYRFRVRANSVSGTFSVRVCDQGTTHPAATDADGPLVAVFAPRELPDFGPSGLSSLGLGGAGIPATFGGGPDDPTAALVDNLSADFIGVGTLWILK